MDVILSVVMLAALALLAGAAFLWRRGSARKQAGLMLLLAVVMIVNVLIWTVPDSSGIAPLERAAAGEPG
jgi:hypothetical protein